MCNGNSKKRTQSIISKNSAVIAEASTEVEDRAYSWLQDNATMYRGNNASDCMVNAYIAGAYSIINEVKEKA